MKDERIYIGLTFEHYAKKHNKQRVVTDVLTTTNNNGDVVKIAYITEHDFMGQKVRGEETASAILRSLA